MTPNEAQKLLDLLKPTRCLMASVNDLVTGEYHEAAATVFKSARAELEAFAEHLHAQSVLPPEVAAAPPPAVQ